MARAQPPAQGGDEITKFDDEFDDTSTLSNWKLHSKVEGWPDQAQILDINTTSPGNLYIVPYTSGWYADYRGILLFKEVTGDFIVTARVKATGKNSDSPRSHFSLGGVMVRTPRTVTPDTWQPKQENWVFINTGWGDESNRSKAQFETKTTKNSDSVLILNGAKPGWLNLRVARVGSTFFMMYKFDDGDWVINQRYDRPDMPDMLQVGIDAYTDWDNVSGDPKDFNSQVNTDSSTNPDLILYVDYIHFSRPDVPDDLKGKPLSDKKQVDDATLLKFLGP